jgi:SAM-dependent methyltransferase
LLPLTHLLIACDVLEHVPDDHRAMREIHRVLRRGGYAILTVPQQDGLAETLEDATITSTKL